MKTSHLVACAGVFAAILIVVLWWRQSEMADNLAALRARLDALSPPPHVAAAEPNTPAFVPEASEPRAIADGELASAEERIADLERVADGQADAIEALLDRLNGMDLSQKRASASAWSALQAVGAPDSAAGDQRTAWAPATEDGGQEWLQVDFEHAVEAATIIVRENCAPGAIVRISAVNEAGGETPLWQGDAPKVVAVSNTPFAATGNVLTSRVKVYLDTKKIPGWNEIDAVQLIGRDGSRQWAVGASASSSYGAGGAAMQLGDNGLGRLNVDYGISTIEVDRKFDAWAESSQVDSQAMAAKNVRLYFSK
jgi:hypothetical protein